MTTNTYEAYAQRARASYDESLARTVAALRELADAVEQEGRVDDFEGVAASRHTQAASRVVRIIVSQTSSHLDLDRLIRHAGTADGVEAGAIIVDLGGNP